MATAKETLIKKLGEDGYRKLMQDNARKAAKSRTAKTGFAIYAGTDKHKQASKKGLETRWNDEQGKSAQ